MKILCVIDSLGSGGAQRQLVNLACGLKARGHIVDVFIYYPHQDFFLSELAEAGVAVHALPKKGKLGVNVLVGLVRLLHAGKYDALISFLDTPNVYSVVASIFSPRLKLVVSERSSHHHDKNKYLALGKRLLYGFTDKVVANSKSQAEWLRRYPWLRGKTMAIYNGFPMADQAASGEIPPMSFLVVGRIGPEKNGIRLVEALELFRRKHGYVPDISWAGKEDILPAGQRYVSALRAILDKYPGVRAQWNWLGERRDIMDLLREHRALIHPSLYEGLPNVVCEAFIAGRPVIASGVCDHPSLVDEPARGFIFDPLDPVQICKAIEHVVFLSEQEWREMSENSMNYARSQLGVDRMVEEYEALLGGAGRSLQPFS